LLPLYREALLSPLLLREQSQQQVFGMLHACFLLPPFQGFNETIADRWQGGPGRSCLGSAKVARSALWNGGMQRARWTECPQSNRIDKKH
jgi:hypothetical protein